tara:strand:+ start:303 stop:470 length:168 start_codon:yes stop_codon:yes gene_type:complete
LYVCSPKFSATAVHCLGLEKELKKNIFFLVRLKIVFIFAAANKYSKKDQGDFGKI